MTWVDSFRKICPVRHGIGRNQPIPLAEHARIQKIPLRDARAHIFPEAAHVLGCSVGRVCRLYFAIPKLFPRLGGTTAGLIPHFWRTAPHNQNNSRNKEDGFGGHWRHFPRCEPTVKKTFHAVEWKNFLPSEPWFCYSDAIDALTTEQVARMLGVSRARVRQFILAKRLKAKKIGRDHFIEQKEAERFKREGRLPEGRPPNKRRKPLRKR
jgi:excisionase family DNA binding protein